MHALFLGFALAAAPAAPPAPAKPAVAEQPAKAPRDIWDFYQVLAKDRAVAPVLVRDADGTVDFIKQEVNGPEPRDLVVVDSKNGYMKFHYSQNSETVNVTMALFTTKSEKKFIGVSIGKIIERETEDRYTLHFYEFIGAAHRDVTDKLRRVSSDEFMDSWFTSRFSTSGIAEVVYTLPREGTTMDASLREALHNAPDPGSDSEEASPEEEKTLKAFRSHQKYQSIDLNWSKKDENFIMGKKH